MIDLDGSGFVTLREIERILMGVKAGDRFLREKFDDADTGIIFGVDEQQVSPSVACYTCALFSSLY